MEEMLIEVKSARAHTQLINFDPQLLKEYCLLQRSSLSPFSPTPRAQAHNSPSHPSHSSRGICLPVSPSHCRICG